MNFKTLFVVAGILAGSAGAAFAQDLPASVSAAIANAAQICEVTPAECAAATQVAIAAMDAAGLTGDARDGALASLAVTLTETGAALPAAVQAQIAAAVAVVASNLSATSPLRATLTEVVAALNAGQGSTVVALVASPN